MARPQICGAVLSLRYSEDTIALWTRSTDPTIVASLTSTLTQMLFLPPVHQDPCSFLK